MENNNIKIIITTVIIISLIILSVGLISTLNKKEEKDDKPEEKTTINEIAEGTEFDLAYLKLENNEINMVYSPLSIKYALSMLKEGASGETEKELAKVLENITLNNYVSKDDILSFANSVFIKEKFRNNINEKYIENLTKKYNAEVNYDEFKNADRINKWVEDKTLGIIKNIINEEQINKEELSLMLINALAIDMEWETEFKYKDTYGKEFTLKNGNKVTATTLNKKAQSEDISYYISDDLTVLSMDLKKYDDIQLEFIAIMPDDLKLYIENVTIEDINSITSKLQKTIYDKKKEVNIAIPKFKYDYTLKLVEDLKSQGIETAFNHSLADFSKMEDGTLGIYVDNAIHKADIEFTEKGIKAAAVTVIIMEANSSIEEKEIINVDIDKPFMYIIREKNTKDVWFVGTVYEPSLWENDYKQYNK